MKKIFLGCFALLCLGLFACDDDKEYSKTIHANSDEVFSGQYHTVTLMASVYGEGITERGVCWSKDEYPTLDDYSQVDPGKGAGSFEAVIDGLTAGTVYYVCSYATGGGKTIYGSQRRIVTTAYLNTRITGTTPELTKIEVKANIADGLESLEITERGVVYGTSATNLETTGTKLRAATGGKGNFTVKITDLDMDTQYYIKSYAVSSEGTIYSDVVAEKTTDPGSILEYGAIYKKDNNFAMHYSFDLDANNEGTITITYIKPDGNAERVTRSVTFDDDYTEVLWNKVSNNGIDFGGISWASGEFAVVGTEGLSVETGIDSDDVYSMFVQEKVGGLGRCSELAANNHHSSIKPVWDNFVLLELNGGYNGLMTRYTYDDEVQWLCVEFASANGKPNIPVVQDKAKFSFGSFFWNDDPDVQQAGWDDLEPFRDVVFNANGVIIVRAQKQTRTVKQGGFDYYMISADGEGWLKWYFRLEGD